MKKKPNVFVITPFTDMLLALYEELKKEFADDFEFTNAGDLDNQQSILKDIVEGIYNADVIISDLTGLNSNVFYEMGLAHALNKKVIIITQDIGELPFDIKSYRAIEYSLYFNKLPLLIAELRKLLNGAVDNSIKYGNPVSDFIPEYNKAFITISPSVNNTGDKWIEAQNTAEQDLVDDDEELGLIDYIADIDENSSAMINEINLIGDELIELNGSISNTTKEINRVKLESGSVDANFIRGACRKLSIPIENAARTLNGHVNEVTKYWERVENSYLSLLDNPQAKTVIKASDIHETMISLEGMKEAIIDSNRDVDGFIQILQGCLGMERRLNKSISSYINEIENYKQMTDTMASSVDRILAKGKMFIEAMNK